MTSKIKWKCRYELVEYKSGQWTTSRIRSPWETTDFSFLVSFSELLGDAIDWVHVVSYPLSCIAQSAPCKRGKNRPWEERKERSADTVNTPSSPSSFYYSVDLFPPINTNSRRKEHIGGGRRGGKCKIQISNGAGRWGTVANSEIFFSVIEKIFFWWTYLRMDYDMFTGITVTLTYPTVSYRTSMAMLSVDEASRPSSWSKPGRQPQPLLSSPCHQPLPALSVDSHSEIRKPNFEFEIDK